MPGFYKPAREGMQIPLPDGRMFPAQGQPVDETNPFMRRLIADSSIVKAPRPVMPKGKPGSKTPAAD